MLIGFIGIVTSFVMIYYRRELIEFTGPWGWAESMFGGGGSYTGVFVIGVLMFFLSLAYATGTLDDVLMATVGKLI